MSWRHSALSNGIEAFISRMIAEGPSANLPPHIALEPVLLSSRSLKLAVLGFAILAGGCDRQSGENAQPQPSESAAPGGPGGGAPVEGVVDRSHKGSLLPDFTLDDPAGKQLKLQSLKGKPLLINLWATWCGPCVAELPMLSKLAVDRVGELQVVIVSQDMETGKVAPFLAAHGAVQFAAWLDPKNELLAHYESGTLPTTVFYDKDGKEVWRYLGSHDWSSAETAEMLKEGL
jgi:thiol-disulfide isomerase/thioredoxin